MISQSQIKDEAYDNYSIADDHETGSCHIFITHMKALIKKRFNLYKRNYKGLIVELLIPVLLVLVGFGFSQIQYFF